MAVNPSSRVLPGNAEVWVSFPHLHGRDLCLLAERVGVLASAARPALAVSARRVQIVLLKLAI
jgi:hypothetical protein